MFWAGRSASLKAEEMSRTDSPGPMRLYFVRHGESDANLQRVFSNRDLPHGLTDTGRAQVERLAEQLIDIPFAAFYVSPTLRARQSADILSARLRLVYTVTPALAEFDVGILEGRSDAESWRRYEDLLDAWLCRRQWQARIEGGESFEDVHARFSRLIGALRAQPPGGPVLLLGHGGTFICMLPQLLSNVTVEFARERSLGHTEVVIAELQSERLTCVTWGSERFADQP
jgi:broad specificity phosphatase PhoE